MMCEGAVHCENWHGIQVETTQTLHPNAYRPRPRPRDGRQTAGFFSTTWKPSPWAAASSLGAGAGVDAGAGVGAGAGAGTDAGDAVRGGGAGADPRAASRSRHPPDLTPPRAPGRYAPLEGGGAAVLTGSARAGGDGKAVAGVVFRHAVSPTIAARAGGAAGSGGRVRPAARRASASSSRCA
jgi:hypothetical protein